MLSPQQCQQARISRDPRFDGLFFVLVNTTKIFCRNICKVRLPLEKNVDYVGSAQAAINLGYRPCLRCRPDSAPHSPAWLGVNTTVKRAINLLTTRLDNNIDDIADALGITPRYLHKLFKEHLQISPKRFRIYQQLLLAKRLLQETNLSVDAVAGAVGFSSARQLQTHVKTYLRLSPFQLRKAYLRDNLPIDIGMFSEKINISLSYRPPYDWPLVRDFFAKRQITGNESIDENSISKVLVIDENEVQVQIMHKPNKHSFALSFSPEYVNKTPGIISTVRRMLDLDACPQMIEKALGAAGLPSDDIVKGLRIPGVANEFEAACRAILGQQVSVAAAVNKINEFYAYFASQYSQRGFPSPQQVAKDTLLFLKIPTKRRQSLIDMAKFYCNVSQGMAQVAQSDQSDNMAVSHKAVGHDVEQLIDITGIGPWTINYIKMRALANADICLDNDLIIKKQMQKYKADGMPLMAEKAAPWRSYFTLNLWSLS